MKKFIWNWKFKYSLLNKKEKRIFPLLLLSMMILSVSAVSAMIPQHYQVEFYDQNDQELFVHEFKEGTSVDLESYQPKDPENIFYGWAFEKDSMWIQSEILELDQDLKLYAVWGRYEDRVVQKELDYKETKKEDDSILKGEEKLRQKGEKGLKQFIYQEFIVGEKVVKKKLLEEKIVKEPKDKIILVGTKEEKLVQENRQKEASQEKSNIQAKKREIEPKKKELPKSSPRKEEKKTVAQKPKSPEKKAQAVEKKPFLPESKEKVMENIYLVNGEYRVGLIPNQYNDRFKNCKQLWTVYPYGVDKHHPAYKNYPGGDRDKDGWACEVKGTPGGFYGD